MNHPTSFLATIALLSLLATLPAAFASQVSRDPCPMGTAGVNCTDCAPGFFWKEPEGCMLCPTHHVCPGGPQGDTLPTTCATGYTGAYCGLCAEKFYRERAGTHECVACPASSAMPAAVSVLLLAVVFFAMGYWATRSRMAAAQASNLLIALQLMGSLAFIDLPWPSSVIGTLDFVGLASMRLDILPMECSGSWSLLGQFLLVLLLPTVIAIVLWVLQRRSAGATTTTTTTTTTAAAATSEGGAVERLLSLLTAGVYVPWTVYSFVVMQCKDIGDRDFVLRFDENVECFGGQHVASMIAAAVVIVCCTLGFPVATYRKRKSSSWPRLVARLYDTIPTGCAWQTTLFGYALFVLIFCTATEMNDTMQVFFPVTASLVYTAVIWHNKPLSKLQGTWYRKSLSNGLNSMALLQSALLCILQLCLLGLAIAPEVTTGLETFTNVVAVLVLNGLVQTSQFRARGASEAQPEQHPSTPMVRV